MVFALGVAGGGGGGERINWFEMLYTHVLYWDILDRSDTPQPITSHNNNNNISTSTNKL